MIRNPWKTPTRSMAVIVTALAFGALAACGSSGPSEHPAGATSSAPSSSSGSVLSAQESSFLTAAENAPTGLTVRTPLKQAPPKGDTFVWLQCEVTACTLIGEGIKSAVAALGWHLKIINYNDADVATLISGLKQALDYGPVGVGVSGVPPATGWQSELAQYQAKHIPIVGSFLGPAALGGTLISNQGGPATFKDQAQIMADWFIKASGGDGQALLEVVTSYPTLKLYASSFADDVAANCSKCKVTTIDNTIADLTNGNIVSTVVSAAKRNPNAKFLITSDGAFVDGLPAALSAAGLGGKIEIGGAFPDASNLTAVKSGEEQAFTGIAYLYSGWLMIDSLLRHMQGMPFVADNPLPTQLLTTNVSFKISTSYDAPANYGAQFSKLWHV